MPGVDAVADGRRGGGGRRGRGLRPFCGGHRPSELAADPFRPQAPLPSRRPGALRPPRLVEHRLRAGVAAGPTCAGRALLLSPRSEMVSIQAAASAAVRRRIPHKSQNLRGSRAVSPAPRLRVCIHGQWAGGGPVAAVTRAAVCVGQSPFFLSGIRRRAGAGLAI